VFLYFVVSLFAKQEEPPAPPSTALVPQNMSGRQAGMPRTISLCRQRLYKSGELDDDDYY
jgi:hypothetical protein